MGMSISSAASGYNVQKNNFHQRRQEFQNLQQALQSGDLNSAQSAFAALNPSGSNSQGPSNDAMSQIGQALQAGDVEGAQKAFAALKADRAHHHGHHGHSQEQTQTATDTENSTPASAVQALLGGSSFDAIG